MRDSPIEWTHDTFNPWWGCTKVSAGCENCYAESLAKRFGHRVWGPDKTRRAMSDAYWRAPFRWNEQAAAEGTPRRVFCASMADVFEERAPPEERRRLWRLVEETPHLRWLLLTKRPQRISALVPRTWLQRPPENVWYGTSVESSQVLERIAALTQVPGTVRFLSIEPLLEPIPLLPLAGVDWVIVGGESGQRARPIEAAWVRTIRDVCRAQGVAFFFKQWGGTFNKRNGRDLDGRTWDELPGEKRKDGSQGRI